MVTTQDPHQLPRPKGWRRVASAALVGVGVVVMAALALVFRGTGLGLGVGNFFAPRIEAPEPEVADFDESVPPLPASVLTVPIAYDLAPVIQKLEDVIPHTQGSLARRIPVEGNDRADVAYEIRRGPFRAELNGDVARLSTVISYKARAWYDPPVLPEIRFSCGTDAGEPEPRARVALRARLSIGSDWALRGRARVERLAPLSDTDRDRCRVSRLNIDVTDRVIGAAERALTDHLPEVDAALHGIDLRSRFERWWGLLQEPIELDDDVWLVIDPSQVHRGTAEGSGQVLSAVVSLTARPHVVWGARPHPQLRPLPELDSAHVEEGLQIQAAGMIDYQAASERMSVELAGEEIVLPGGTIRVGGISVRGIGAGKLALELNFRGAARGRLFLRGTPEFDPATGMIHVPDLDFDVASQSLLVQGMDWLAHPGVVETLRERARWEVADVLALAEKQINRGLNRELSDDVRLIGSVESIDVTGLYPQRDRLVVHAKATARARLVIVEEPAPAAGPAAGGPAPAAR